MGATFRQSMGWLHTWAGLVLGSVLFAIFWMGTLAVFDREIDRWMAPMTRLPMADGSAVLDDILRPFIQDAIVARTPALLVVLPSERMPTMSISYRSGATTVRHQLDASSGAILVESGTKAGTEFIYPFHYNLHIRFANIGVWLVGLSGMVMLALCVSGVIIHRKIFSDFFTFRPRKASRRVLLDLHNVAGVLGLPFHIVITISGLIIFYAVYFPSAWQTLYPDQRTFSSDIFTSYGRNKTGVEKDIGSLNEILVNARRLWGGAKIQSLSIHHPGDAAAYVRVNRSMEDRIKLQGDVAYFDAINAGLLYQRASEKTAIATQSFIAGLHFIQFRHWALRWLYFVLGLLGCVLIATGFLFWLESRRQKHAQLGFHGVRVVEALAVGSTTGIIIATLAFFIANRLLPLGAAFAGIERAALEVCAFYLVWIATFAHASLRPRCAWHEQCSVIAAFAIVAVGLNWITTGDHLVRSYSQQHLRSVAGMDSVMLLGASVAILIAYRLRRAERQAPLQSGNRAA